MHHTREPRKGVVSMTDTPSCMFTEASTEWIKSHLDRMDRGVPREKAPSESGARGSDAAGTRNGSTAPPIPAR
jgi:hypothetical protein